MNEEIKAMYAFRPKKNEHDLVKEFLIKQTNFTETIRYLIEEEIKRNGIRDIVKYVPMVRDVELPNHDKKDETKHIKDIELNENKHKKSEKKKLEKVKEEIAVTELEEFKSQQISEEIEGQITADQILKDEISIESKSISKNEDVEEIKEKAEKKDKEKDEEIPDCYI